MGEPILVSWTPAETEPATPVAVEGGVDARCYLLLILAALGCTRCGARPAAPGAAEAVRPAPTWLALGQETYRYREALDAQAAPLALGMDPRWFGGTPLPPAKPVLLGGLPLHDRGASLGLAVRIGAPGGDVELTLTLRAGGRAIWREIEHRWNNTTPFLLGFYADGQPVLRSFAGAAKRGGSQSFVERVPAGAERTWILRIQRASLDRVLPKPVPKRLEVVAAFSERQHSESAAVADEGYAMPVPQDIKLPFKDAPIRLRSRLVRMDLWR